ncbi:glycosyltransferase [Portibacter marinus]|uniref:glycosyltransferase n=1 Tax=Portibacter marinus TaxID=2898660 RepID=UPI001F3ACB6B|nr:glycosyltransferase [Portibacter marinus]
MKAFKDLGVDAHLISLYDEEVQIDGKTIGFTKHLRNRLVKQFKSSRFFKITRNNVAWQSDSILYLRFLKVNYSVIRFLRYLKRKKFTVVVEYPSYPYSVEDKGLKAKYYSLLDRILKKTFNKHVDLTVNFNNLKIIENKPSIPISNGIQVKPLPNLSNWGIKNQEIHLIGVANISFWHGYDRIIKGLAEYYKSDHNSKVFFHVVGDSSEKKNLEKLVIKLKLEDHVIFHGFQSGTSLSRLITQSNIGVGSLGLHRLKLDSTSTLKSKEYTLNGLPILVDPKDPDFKNVDFAYLISYDESIIDINDVVRFYKKLISKNENNQYIQDFAVKNFSWTAKMQEVLKFAS